MAKYQVNEVSNIFATVVVFLTGEVILDRGNITCDLERLFLQGSLYHSLNLVLAVEGVNPGLDGWELVLDGFAGRENAGKLSDEFFNLFNDVGNVLGGNVVYDSLNNGSKCVLSV